MTSTSLVAPVFTFNRSSRSRVSRSVIEMLASSLFGCSFFNALSMKSLFSIAFQVEDSDRRAEFQMRLHSTTLFSASAFLRVSSSEAPR